MNTGFQQIALALMFTTGSTALAAAPDQGAGRAASLAEIQELFTLATNGQPRCHFVADIEMRETPWTAQQIAEEAKHIQEFLAEADRNTSRGPNASRPGAISEVQSNAIVRAHSGVRLYHVEEWYSGKLYRLDQTDESASVGNVKFVPGHYQETYVNLRDLDFSPYTSYDVMHHLRSVSLTRKTNSVWATHDLWEAKGLENEVGGHLVAALVDLQSVPGKGRVPGDWLKTTQMDAAKAKSLQEGNDKHWHLTASDESFAGVAVTRFTLTGKSPGMAEGFFPLIEISYWIARQGQRPICLQATLTNLTSHSSYVSRREDFADNGYPRVWKKSFFKAGALEKEMTITFKQVDPEATFDEAEVFLPEFLHYYMVSDVTSGTGVPAKDVFKDVAVNDPADSASGPAKPGGTP